MIVSCFITRLQDKTITAAKPLKNAAELKYLGMSATNQNFVYKVITSRVNLENTCYLLVQNFYFSVYYIENLKVKIYKNLI